MVVSFSLGRYVICRLTPVGQLSSYHCRLKDLALIRLVVLLWEAGFFVFFFFLPGDTWQRMETFFIVMVGVGCLPSGSG